MVSTTACQSFTTHRPVIGYLRFARPIPESFRDVATFGEVPVSDRGPTSMGLGLGGRQLQRGLDPPVPYGLSYPPQFFVYAGCSQALPLTWALCSQLTLDRSQGLRAGFSRATHTGTHFLIP